MNNNETICNDLDNKMIESISQMSISTLSNYSPSKSHSPLFVKDMFSVNDPSPCNKRAKMIEGMKVVPVPLIDSFDLISPPESPLNNDEGLRSVFRRMDEDDKLNVKQPKLRRKNTGLSISTTLEWQPTEDTPIAPKHRKPFKSFWNDLLSNSPSDDKVISDSFSIGHCNSPKKSKRNNRLTICRRLRNAIHHNSDDNSLDKYKSNPRIVTKISTSSTFDSSITYSLQNYDGSSNSSTALYNKRKASNGTRLAKFRIRNSEHYASL